MNHLPSLPKGAHLADLWKTIKDPSVAPLLEVHDVLLRDDGALSVAERELIAAYVSGLNGCEFCYGAHKRYAVAFGYAPEDVDAVVRDPSSAPIDAKMRPLLAYVQKLTQAPTSLSQADSNAVYDAGWSEEALYAAIMVCALFNMMNRIVEGSGIEFRFKGDASEGELKKRRKSTYEDFGRTLNLPRRAQDVEA